MNLDVPPEEDARRAVAIAKHEPECVGVTRLAQILNLDEEAAPERSRWCCRPPPCFASLLLWLLGHNAGPVAEAAEPAKMA
jgi:hypothetical protein